MAKGPTFVFGDKDKRPLKPSRGPEILLRDLFTLHGLIGIGITLQLIATLVLPKILALALGGAAVLYVSFDSILIALGFRENPHLKDVVIGKSGAFLDFAAQDHLGKPAGALAEDPTTPDWAKTATVEEVKKRTKLALLMVGARCDGQMGAFDGDYKWVRTMFAGMLKELQTAKPEDDIGFLNVELFMHSERSQNNTLMAVVFFRSFAHIQKFAHNEDLVHWQAWNKFRELQRSDYKTTTKMGLWHEAYEVTNAEAVYLNMRPFGLGNMWDYVPAPASALDTEKGEPNAVVPKGKYRSSLVMCTGNFFTSKGRMRMNDGTDWTDEAYFEKYDKKKKETKV